MTETQNGLHQNVEVPNGPRRAGDLFTVPHILFTVSGVAVGAVITYFTLLFTISGRIDSVSGRIDSAIGAQSTTNGRIDQVYPLLLQQSKDVGDIRVELKAAADLSSHVAALLESMAKSQADLNTKQTLLADRQEALVSKLEAQSSTVQNIASEIGTLTNNVNNQGSILVRIESKIGLQPSPPLKKTELDIGGYVFAPFALAKALESQPEKSGFKVITGVDWGEPAMFDKFTSDWKSIPYSKQFFLVTKDQNAYDSLLQTLNKK
jgi:hypothetical protein